jgi:3-phenylpropionate/trans-cinnamate dioxygenase ferredoxin reductase subunit
MMADHLAGLHRAMGTSFYFHSGVSRLIEDSGRVVAVVDTEGREHPADVVLVGIGAAPRDELARACGLGVNGGIVVDERLCTTDPDIYAVGDCAVFPGRAGAPTRLESVQNAADQARHVASQILGSDNHPYRAVPWFWSLQEQIRLQIAGLAGPTDEAVMGSRSDDDRFSVYRFRGDHLVAVESLGRPADHVAARRLLATQHRSLRALVQDPEFDLKSHVRRLEPAH